MSAESGPRHVVLRAPNWLGDAVLAIPAMAAVRAHFATARLTVAAPPSVAALFREVTPVNPNQVIDLPASHRSAIAALKRLDPDLVTLFPNSFRSAWQAKRAGIPERWGYGTGARRWLLTRVSAKARPEHQADYYRALVAGLGIAVGEGLPRVGATPEAVHAAHALLTRAGAGEQPYVALLPGAAYGQAKQWPAERMADVAARVIRTHGVSCVVLGATHDRLAAREIESWLRVHAPDAASACVDLVGQTSLGALTAILERALVCVSNDSGGMHVAAATGTPVVALFGPTNERATRPLGAHDVLLEPVFCRPCMLRDCPIDHRCMKRLTVERVFVAVSAKLARQGGA
jgi:heptosyltransferase-2